MAEEVLPVRITVKEQQAVQAIKKINNELKKTGSTLKFAEKGTAKFNTSLGSIAKNAAVASVGFMSVAGAVNTVKRAAVGIVSDFAKFEQSLANVGTLLDKNTNLWNTFANDIFRVSSKFGKDAAEGARGLYDVISAGITDSADSLKALELATAASTAGMTDINTAVKAGVSVMNAYGLSVDDLNSIYNIQFDTVRKGVITYGELAQAQAILIPSAQRLGVSIQDFNTGIAVLTKNGQRAELATVSLARAFDSMAEKKDVFKSIGVDIFNAQGEFAGLEGILQKLNKAFQGMNTEQKNVLFSTLKFEKRAARAFSVLIDKADDYGETLKQVGTDANSMADAVTVAMDTLQAQAKITANRMKNFFKEAFQPVGNFAKEALKVMNKTAEESDKLAQKFKLREIMQESGMSAQQARKFIFETETVFAPLKTQDTGGIQSGIGRAQENKIDEANKKVVKSQEKLEESTISVASAMIDAAQQTSKLTPELKRTEKQIFGFLPKVGGYGGQRDIAQRAYDSRRIKGTGYGGQQSIFDIYGQTVRSGKGLQSSEQTQSLMNQYLENIDRLATKEESTLEDKKKKEDKMLKKWNDAANSWSDLASAMAGFEQAFGLSGAASGVVGGAAGMVGGAAQFAAGGPLGMLTGGLTMATGGKGILDSLFGGSGKSSMDRLADSIAELSGSIDGMGLTKQIQSVQIDKLKSISTKLSDFEKTTILGTGGYSGVATRTDIVQGMGIDKFIDSAVQAGLSANVAKDISRAYDIQTDTGRIVSQAGVDEANQILADQNEQLKNSIINGLGIGSQSILGALSQGGTDMVEQLRKQAIESALLSTEPFQQLSAAISEDFFQAATKSAQEFGANIDLTGDTDSLISQLGALSEEIGLNTSATDINSSTIMRTSNVPSGARVVGATYRAEGLISNASQIEQAVQNEFGVKIEIASNDSHIVRTVRTDDARVAVTQSSTSYSDRGDL